MDSSFHINIKHKEEFKMSLYGNNASLNIDADFNLQEAVEMFAYDDLQRMSSKALKEFCESDHCQALVERAVLKKPTVMRLSKADDEKRRIKLICYQLARENHDPNWDKYVKSRASWKNIVQLWKKTESKKGT